MRAGDRTNLISLRLRDRHVFLWQSLEILNVLNNLTLKQIFWKMKTFFKKLEYRFSVESTKTESALFPYKTALSEANVKTNRIVSKKWTYHKERSFASNYFILKNSYKELFWCTNDTNVHIHTFRSRWNFIWGLFSLWVSLISILVMIR